MKRAALAALALLAVSLITACGGGGGKPAPPAPVPTPTITSISPTHGSTGTAVTITGTNLGNTSAVTFNGRAAFSLSVKSDSQVEAVVPALATTGVIAVTTLKGQATSSTFTVDANRPPVITSFTPTTLMPGTVITMLGSHFVGTSRVNFGPVQASFTVDSDRQLRITAPVDLTAGDIAVTNQEGTTFSEAFTVDTGGANLDLWVDKVQFTQSTQTLDNKVPIVAGKAGLIRVFVLANHFNTAAPTVRVTLLNGGVPVTGYPKLVAAPRAGVPTTFGESTLGGSWNLAVPAAHLTTPVGTGYTVQAEVDPAELIPETSEVNNTATATFTSTTVPTFKTTIFPVARTTGTGNVTVGNLDQWVARLAKMFPIGSVEVTLGATFTSSVVLGSDGTGWSTLLTELAAKHQLDASSLGGSDRYYYGALSVDYGSGVAGLGYVPSSPSSSFYYRTAIGWDKTSGYSDGGLFPEVFAHEVGHNMGRPHSPCGSVASSDPAYPHAGGYIGVWGYDSGFNALHSPFTDKDIMGYCTPNWVSDYVYKQILDFRNGTGGFLTVGAEDAPAPKSQTPVRDCLLVRGILHGDGRVELLPAFRTATRPSGQAGPADYLLKGLDATGTTLFTQALEWVEVGCSPQGQERHFIMALPLEATVLDALAGLQVAKGGQTLASLSSVSPGARIMTTAPSAQRLSADQLQLTWDAAVHPAALVRDADTGEVIAILSGGRQTIQATGKRFDLILSDGVSSRTHHIETPE
ncbi:MAG: IPT/TIG domain-containing protein [Holophagaceae bacterium]|uniref:IPT/TIG domain-containing protein n=1 Tax=Candidatus Geothrix odensensis TaxID=2954440 RepID=A0A936K6V0_9BACT|nr:IPT/TIG domain-containing protein [Candidatus Geothrix odensensis]